MVINSLSVVSCNSILVKYADDVTVLHHVAPSHLDESQEEIDNIASWATRNKMLINVKKSFIMNFQLNDNNDTIINNLQLSNENIIIHEKTKLLGVVITSDCKSNAHLLTVYGRCCCGMSIVRKLARIGLS